MGKSFISPSALLHIIFHNYVKAIYMILYYMWSLNCSVFGLNHFLFMNWQFWLTSLWIWQDRSIIWLTDSFYFYESNEIILKTQLMKLIDFLLWFTYKNTSSMYKRLWLLIVKPVSFVYASKFSLYFQFWSFSLKSKPHSFRLYFILLFDHSHAF